MPRHDYVKSGRLAVTEKTKPINIYLHILNYISNLFIFIKKLVSKNFFEILKILKDIKNVYI